MISDSGNILSGNIQLISFLPFIVIFKPEHEIWFRKKDKNEKSII